MKEMCLVHNDYDRISDIVMWLGNGVSLKFNVDLFYVRKINKNSTAKENYHKEYLYTDKDKYSRVKIARNFSYYFSIDVSRNDLKTYVKLFHADIYFIIFNLKRVMKWMAGEDGVNKIFAKRQDGRIVVVNRPDPIKVQLQFDQYIEFEPAVDYSTGYDIVGINVYMNNDSSMFFMPSNIIFSLYQMLSTCNMYQLAQNMLNYIGRPSYGTNLFDMNTMENTSNYTYNRNKRSFFDIANAVNRDE